ncbi:hypothetical protein SNEBB_007835 [Seison nebaliae]|nr:hypothetical protein SNEBB_007835 [Seison nebaliae]
MKLLMLDWLGEGNGLIEEVFAIDNFLYIFPFIQRKIVELFFSSTTTIRSNELNNFVYVTSILKLVIVFMRMLNNFLKERRLKGRMRHWTSSMENIFSNWKIFCGICLENHYENFVILHCGHIYCKNCFGEYYKDFKEQQCCSCQTPFLLTPQNISIISSIVS